MRDWSQPCLVLDVDRTLCPLKLPGQEYADLKPFPEMVQRVREYAGKGFYIIIHTARQMRTHNCNIGRIHASTLPTLIHWLDRHQIPYDEIWPDKPWAGFCGVSVDDGTVTPQAFLTEPWEALRARIETQGVYNGF